MNSPTEHRQLNSTNQPLVTVVTPVYNTEKYLPECVESVLRQTYPNWEYFIIDNRSTDGSLEIARSHAARDPRIRVFSNESFLPVIQNWNHALRHISDASKYCKIVHADDWIFPECLTEMVRVMEAHPNVGLVGAYRLEDTHVGLDGLPYPSTVVPGREICRLTLLRRLYVFGSPTSLLLRSDLVRRRHNFYNEANLHADTEICFELLRQVDFGFVHQVLTYTRRHNEATTSFAKRLNTFLPAEIARLVRYGPDVLTAKEYEYRLRRNMEEYYRFLARTLLGRRGTDEFWKYHAAELNKLGWELERSKLLRGCLFVLKEKLVNPVEAARSFSALLRGTVSIPRHRATAARATSTTRS